MVPDEMLQQLPNVCQSHLRRLHSARLPASAVSRTRDWLIMKEETESQMTTGGFGRMVDQHTTL